MEKIMLGSKVGNQLRVTAIMDRYENFRMREGETLDEAYDHFVVLNNEMKKNNIHRTEFDQNVKFVNNLTPEWKPFARFVKQHKPLDELKQYQVFENLRLYEEYVTEPLEVKKKNNPVKDLIALVAEKGIEVKYTSSHRRSDISEGESDDDTDAEIMMENFLSLANNFRKKFYKKPGSNSRWMSSKPRGYDDKERYTPRQNDRYRPSRYERDDQQYEDRYARSFERKETVEKRFEKKDSEEKKIVDKKPNSPSTYFKC